VDSDPVIPHSGKDTGKQMPKNRSWYFGLISLLVLACMIAFVFYFGGYVYILSPDSASYSVQLALAQARVHNNARIIVLGNSTAAEGFRVNSFNERSRNKTALNLGVPSGWMYLWDEILNQAMEVGVRPDSVVIMLTPETISKTDFDFLRNDLAMLKVVEGSSDFSRLVPFVRSPVEYVKYASLIAARPILFRAEIQDLAIHPLKRLRDAKDALDWMRSFRRESEMVQTDNEFAVCDAEPLTSLPSTIEALRRKNDPRVADLERVQAGYAIRAGQKLQIDAHKVDLLRTTMENIARRHILVFVTEAPFYDPNFQQYPESYRRDFSAAVRQAVQSVPGAQLLPKLDADCTMMMDTVHLNRKGGEQFTEYLLTRVL
jgi:hypothetical protein